MRWLTTIAMVSFLTACLGDNRDSTNPDSDDDGYVSAQDCDDSNPAINPGADELCDGLDNDCDEEIDEAAIDAVDFFADTDGDTFGDADSVVTACTPPDGYATDDTDCDDNHEGTHPEAEEACDGLDNDCDGEIDEDALDALVFYADTDSDNYGDASSSVSACAAPEGYVANDTDCDDGNEDINPDATEICDDLMVDEDCDGLSNDEDTDIACPTLILDLTTVMCGLAGEAIFSYNSERSPSSLELAECPSPNTTNTTDGGALSEGSGVLDDGIQYTGGLIYVYPPTNNAPFSQINLRLPFYWVEPGDRLRMTIGCADANFTCDAMAQVNHKNTAGDLAGLINTVQTHDGTVVEVDADLSPLAGTQQQFVFVVTNNNNAGADGIYFANPRIVRLSQ
jgi:hypothetical protein